MGSTHGILSVKNTSQGKYLKIGLWRQACLISWMCCCAWDTPVYCEVNTARVNQQFSFFFLLLCCCFWWSFIWWVGRLSRWTRLLLSLLKSPLTSLSTHQSAVASCREWKGSSQNPSHPLWLKNNNNYWVPYGVVQNIDILVFLNNEKSKTAQLTCP